MSRTTEQRIAHAADSRARYQRRVAERRCVGCNAGLQPEDGVRCVECVERADEANGRYNRTAKALATKRARMKRWRAKARAQGRCVDCSRKAEPGRTRCKRNLAECKASQAAYLDRREAA